MKADDVRRALAFALETYPEKVEAVPLRELVAESARENPRRPAWVKIPLPDELVKSLRGGGDEGDLVLLVRVPREVTQRAGSRIILPGEERR
ncbi:MAG TPA: hypothetical protein VMT16_02015 [Thermoanaerobaculia bacterium]|nr:hypothetical protein [Thermoanaerobaculia bacterium]